MKYIIAADLHFPKASNPLMDAIEAELSIGPAAGSLILAGDLTSRAQAEQYGEAADWMIRLIDMGVKLIVAPGNHDTAMSILWVTKMTNKDGKKRYACLADLIADQPVVEARMDAFDFIFRVDRDVFYATRTTHSGGIPVVGHGKIKVKSDQLEWARAELTQRGLTAGNGYRLHMVCHHSLWELEGDRHGHMSKRRRLVEELLEPLGFETIINGHNHRFDCGRRQVKETGFFINHVQAPMLSSKTEHGTEQSGYVRWDSETPGTAELVKG